MKTYPIKTDLHYQKQLVSDDYYYKIPLEIITLEINLNKFDNDNVTWLKLITTNLHYWIGQDVIDSLNRIYTSAILTKPILRINLNKLSHKQNQLIPIRYGKVENMCYRDVAPKELSWRCDYNKSKYSMFLETLFKEIGRMTPEATSSNVLSLYAGNWSFRDVKQGCLFKIYLSSHNANTLGYITQAYFILITSSNPNLTTQLNVSLKPLLLAAILEVRFSDEFSFEAVNWDETHIDALRSSAVFHPIVVYYELYSIFKEKQQQLKIKFSNELVEEIPLSNEHELKPRISLKAVKIPEPVSYKHYSDMFAFDAVKNATKLPCVDSLSDVCQEPKQSKKTDTNLLTTAFDHDPYAFPIKQKKLWVLDICKKFKALNILKTMQNLEGDLINETMFGATISIKCIYQK